MAWASTDHTAAAEMMEKAHTLSFQARRSHAPRPLSEATEIFDTDGEDSAFDSESDSRTTISTPDELHTPNSVGLAGFEFHFDDSSTKGPTGPHLFRSTPEIPSDSEDERIFLSQSYAPKAAPAARPFSSLNRAVAELDESQVRNWAPSQVAEWMAEAGFERSVVEKFLTHDISGLILLDLQFEDLKELDITSYGKRHRVMSSIQHLRNSSMMSLETPVPLTRSPSRSDRQTRALHRAPLPEETQVLAYATERGGLKSRSSSRRGRRHGHQDDIVTPAESVSIVAIEQLLPKPHACSKGEDCPKWQKQQRKLRKYHEEFAALADHETAPSVVVPSVVASSDVLGPSQIPDFTLTPERLGSVEPRDPQENVRQFLSFQHVRSPASEHSSPAASASCVPPSPRRQAELASLPKLSIPKTSPETPADGKYRTPVSAIGQATQYQAQLKTQLRDDPYHYGGVASPADIYRIDTPFSATDIPVTAMPLDPFPRDVSQSVPPEMLYGATAQAIAVDPVGQRPSSTSTQRHRHVRQRSFAPSVAPVMEGRRSAIPREYRPEPKVQAARVEDIHHAGWMRKRKTTKLLCHEWQDHFVALEGTKLAVHKDDRLDKEPELIDVDDYTLTCSTVASSSKLSAAFKKSILGSNARQHLNEHAYAFSLIPEGDKTKKLFAKQQAHHFSVKSRDDRIDWMRDLMLAKALRRGQESGNEVRVHGNLI